MKERSLAGRKAVAIANKEIPVADSQLMNILCWKTMKGLERKLDKLVAQTGRCPSAVILAFFLPLATFPQYSLS